MFGLGGHTFPQTKEQLIRAIEQGLSEVFRFPARGNIVSAEGDWPNLDLLRVDVTGAVANVDQPPPDFRWVGDRLPAFAAGRLEVSGRPLRLGPAALTAELLADEARFEYDRDKQGRPLLILAAAHLGTASARMAHADLDALAREAAGAAAEPHGIAVSSFDLDLAQLGPRSIGAQVHVKARKMFLSAGVQVEGRVDLDDAMSARLSNLHCRGDGVLGEIACVAIRTHLHRLEGRSYPLSALGDLRLHDVRVSVQDPVRLDAAFGD